MSDQLLDSLQVSISPEEIGMWLLDKLDKNPDQTWQFKVWVDPASKYVYVLGRVPPASWGES